MPPKKQKKQPHNPFYFFMMDWKQEQLEMGHSVPGPLNKLAEAATPAWTSMSEAQKEPYKLKAKIAKEEDKTNLNNKFTVDGKSYAQVYAEQKEVDDFNSTMVREIKDTIKRISQNRESLISHKFYLIHANYYCYWTPKRLYLPCEVAIAEFSIENGVERTLHFFPDVVATEDGKLPVGYLHEAQDTARRTHCVPLPPMRQAETYDVMSAMILSFLKHSGTSKLPPLYTMEDNLNCNYSMSCVKDFLAHCQDECGVPFRTYRLDMLFHDLRNACAELAVREEIDIYASGFPTISIAQMELDRDIFHFTRGISCEYHENMTADDDDVHEVIQFCSLSTVQRWCFLVSDYCCKDVGVQLKRGKHCPMTADLSYGQDPQPIGFGARGQSSSNNAAAQPRYVDAPPPAVNSWGKGPPKMDAKPRQPPVATAPKAAQKSVGVVEGNRAPRAEPAAALPPAPSSESTWRVNGRPAAEPEAEPDDFRTQGLRLPKTRGRGERLLAAINRIQLDNDKEDFPALGAGRGRGRF